MARKKIVVVIVEGPSDEEALGVILNRLYSDNAVYVHIMYRDITTDRDVTVYNILSKLGIEIQQYAKSNHYVKNDFKQIIHIIDMDGAYIPNDKIIENQNVNKPIYSASGILAADKRKIELRNQQKSSIINKLYSCKEIWKTPYEAFYMSCNLDHVLYNKLNSNDDEKEADAYKFAKQYKDQVHEFIKFISGSCFSVMTGYIESWEFIMQDLHSLERYSNFGLCFNEVKIITNNNE